MIEDSLARLKTDGTLLAAIRAAATHEMTPAEKRAQRRSFVIGQVGCSHPDWPRERIEALVDKVLDEEAPSVAIPDRLVVARTMNPEAFRHGDPTYFGPDDVKAWHSAAQRVALARADKILTLFGGLSGSREPAKLKDHERIAINGDAEARIARLEVILPFEVSKWLTTICSHIVSIYDASDDPRVRELAVLIKACAADLGEAFFAPSAAPTKAETEVVADVVQTDPIVCEREACAYLAETHTGMWDNDTAVAIAEAIRERDPSKDDYALVCREAWELVQPVWIMIRHGAPLPLALAARLASASRVVGGGMIDAEPTPQMMAVGGTIIENGLFQNTDPNDTVFDCAGRVWRAMYALGVRPETQGGEA